jgi:hypothetical protein
LFFITLVCSRGSFLEIRLLTEDWLEFGKSAIDGWVALNFPEPSENPGPGEVNLLSLVDAYTNRIHHFLSSFH